MTISSTLARNDYTGSTSVGPYVYGFKITAATDLQVIRRSVAGAETTLTYLTDYTVSGYGNDAGGSITLVNAPLATDILSIRRNFPITQPASIRNQGAYFPSTIEDQLDRAVLIQQQQEDAIARSLKLPPSYNPTGRARHLVPTAGYAVVGDGTGFTTAAIVSTGVALPGAGRTVANLSAYLTNNAVFNVKDFGAVGDGVTDDTAAIQLAMTAAVAAGGVCYVPRATAAGYLVTSAIAITGPVTVIGEDKYHSVLFCSGCDGFSISNGVSFVQIERLSIAQVVRYTTTPNAKTAIKNNSLTATQALRHTYRDVFIDGFETSVLADGVCMSVFDQVETVNGKYGLRAGQQTYNNNVDHCRFNSTTSITGGVGIRVGDGNVNAEGWFITDSLCFGFSRGIWLDSAAFCRVNHCVLDYCGEFGVLDASSIGANIGNDVVDCYIAMYGTADTGIKRINSVAIAVLQDTGTLYADNTVFAYSGSTVARGIWITGTIENRHIIRNNRMAAATYDCRVQTGTNITVSGNTWWGAGFYADVRVTYFGNRGTVLSGLDTSIKVLDYLDVRTVITYSASMTPDLAAGTKHSITATNGTAFTINAPLSPIDGKEMTITIRNGSGGALGAVTWNAVFKMAAWTSPATGFSRSITFSYNGSNWVEESRTPSDVPN